MVDMATTVLITIAAAVWGGVGGFAWWALPPQPSGWTQLVVRLGVGLIVGAVTYAVLGVSVFAPSGAWDPAGVAKIIAAGFVGLSSLGGILPQHFNEKARKMSLRAAPP